MTDPAAARRVYLKMLAATVIWGAMFIVGRYAAQELTPVAIGWYRYLITTVVLVAFTIRAEGRLPRLNRKQLMWTVALGLIGVTIYNLLFFGALERIPASRSALLVSVNPMTTAILVALFFGERMTLQRGLGVLLAFIGTTIVITRGDFAAAIDQSIGVGELMSIASTLCWVAYGLIARYAIRGLSPLAATTYGAIWGWIGLTPIFLATGGSPMDALAFPPLLIGALLYISILGSAVTLVWYYQGLLVIGAARTAVFSNLVPIIGAAFGVSLLGEPLLASMVVGAVITFAGVLLANRQ